MRARLPCGLLGCIRGMALYRSSGYIGGKWKDCETKFPVYNPATGQEIGKVSDMGREDAEEAVKQAYDAFKVWKNVTTKERSQKLRNWYDLIVKHEGDLAEMLTSEQGKPLFEAKGEIKYGASYVEWFAEEAKRIYGDIIPSPASSRRLFSVKQPVGVAALWTPWNFPVAMITRKAAAALAAGCTVIIKPSEETPYCALALQKLAEDAGFPPGVVNTIPCSRDNVNQVTDALLGNDIVAKMSFTGSTATGKLLMSKCIDPIKRVSLELGGNAPFIVFDSADVDAAVAGALGAKFRHTAQTCICANRILVQDKIYDEFASKFAAAVDEQLKVGNGMDASSTQGPLINEKAVEKVESHVKDALSKGAKCLRGGQRHELGGNFFQPTVLSDVTRDMIICSQETFGPVAPLIRFKTEEEAVAIASTAPLRLSETMAIVMAQPQAQLPEPAHLGEVGQWIRICGEVSTPTASQGDWSIWPHMSSQENWNRTMGTRAGLVANFLEAKNIGMDGCMICAEFGRNTQSGFEGHVGGKWHFKHWSRLCWRDEAKDMAQYRERWWEKWDVSGGAIRFNHADGVVEMWKNGNGMGPPPAQPALTGPMPTPGAAMPSASASGGQSVNTHVMVIEMAKTQPRDIFNLCEQENQYYTLCSHIGHPTTPKGDLSSCHWLGTKNTWKPAIKQNVEIVERILHAFNVYPSCMLCPNGVGFAEHVPADKHLRNLWARLQPNVPIVTCAQQLWQHWELPPGILRINHVHGQVWICRGKNPLSNKAIPLPIQAQANQAAASAASVPGYGPQTQNLSAPQTPGAGADFSAVPLGSRSAPSEAPSFGGNSDFVSRPPSTVCSSAFEVSPTIPAQPAPLPVVPAAVMRGIETPQQLPEEGKWFETYPPVSQATNANGDYRAYPHLAGKSQFKASMTPRADIMVRILASQPIPLDPQCTLCERHRGYNEHLGAEKHWKALYPTYTGDGVVISQVRDRVWNKVRIAGGWVRINELDGAIEMAKGTAEPQAMPAAQQQAPPAFAGAPQMPQMTPPMQATPMQPPSAAPPPNNGWANYTGTQTFANPEPGWTMVGPPPPVPEPVIQSVQPQPQSANSWAGWNPQGHSQPQQGQSSAQPGAQPGAWQTPITEPHSYGPQTPPVNQPRDSVSMVNFPGKRSEFDEKLTNVSGSMSGHVGRSSDVGSTLGSWSADRAMEKHYRVYKSKAKNVQVELQRYQVPPQQLRCDICCIGLQIHEVANHFSQRSHFNQMFCDNDEDEEDKVQVFQGGLKLIKLNLTDLTIEESDGLAPGAKRDDGSTGGSLEYSQR